MRHSCVLLADRHPSMLDAVRRLLEGRFETTVMVADEVSLLEAVGRLEPDLVVADLSLPDTGCVSFLNALIGRHSGLNVIVLSVHDEQFAMSRALDAGAKGFVLKRTAAADLTVAVDRVLRGEIYVSSTKDRRPGIDGDKER
jgi:DNA-binding NarL/FixJ family response regulator